MAFILFLSFTIAHPLPPSPERPPPVGITAECCSHGWSWWPDHYSGGTFWPAGYYLRLECGSWYHLGYGRFDGIAGGGARMLVDEFPKPQ